MNAPLNKDVVILGVGEHARGLLSLMAALDIRPVGCVSPAPPKSGLWPQDLCPWLGDDTALRRRSPDVITLVNGVGSVGATTLRQNVYSAAVALGYEFLPLVHPKAILSPDVGRTDGLQLSAGAIVQNNVQLGENVLLNTGCIVDHDCIIGPHVHVSPGATLSGAVALGAGVHVGVGATIKQGVSVGAGSIIGAGAVVIRDVAAGATVVGVPAHEI